MGIKTKVCGQTGHLTCSQKLLRSAVAVQQNLHCLISSMQNELCFCSGASSAADPLEDDSQKHVWSWELRDAKVLPKALRQQAQAVKKALLKVTNISDTTADSLHVLQNDHQFKNQNTVAVDHILLKPYILTVLSPASKAARGKTHLQLSLFVSMLGTRCCALREPT